MSQPVRRRLEQPSAEKAKRSGCLVWGAVLGVLVGIMVGLYALPPVLKHYYGETHIAVDEFYRGDGKAIRVLAISQASDPAGEPTLGMRREDFYVRVVVVSERHWEPRVSDFSLELKELHSWRRAASQEEALGVPAGVETEIELHFFVEFAPSEAEQLTPEALHLADPRVRFELAPP